MKRSWRRRFLERWVCSRSSHRFVPLRVEPRHPGAFCSRCLRVRGGGRWRFTGMGRRDRADSPWYAPGESLWARYYREYRQFRWSKVA